MVRYFYCLHSNDFHRSYYTEWADVGRCHFIRYKVWFNFIWISIFYSKAIYEEVKEVKDDVYEDMRLPSVNRAQDDKKGPIYGNLWQGPRQWKHAFIKINTYILVIGKTGKKFDCVGSWMLNVDGMTIMN